MAGEAGASPEDLFSALIAHFGAPHEGPPGKGFGSRALKVEGRIFASLTKGELLLKLPRERVDALVVAGAGARLSTGGGAPKREWITVPPGAANWLSLAEEARAYVGAGKP